MSTLFIFQFSKPILNVGDCLIAWRQMCPPNLQAPTKQQSRFIVTSLKKPELSCRTQLRRDSKRILRVLPPSKLQCLNQIFFRFI